LVHHLKTRTKRPGEGGNWLKFAPAAIAIVAFLSLSGLAHADTRTLKLHFVHTGEKAEITYKRNGKYIDSGLQKANRILRDFRRNEPTKMDPKLLDLVWEVYQASGSKGYVNVISAYRSPTTNSMLRSRGRGVAKNSQHTLGRAMDFFLTDVKLSKLREIGLKMGAGGVGFYPTSGSPFVHLDTGRVRHWPRMSRQELARIFPDGKTMHVPTDGKPLPRYEQAVAEYKAKGKQSSIVVASAEEPKKKGFFERLAGGTDDEASEDDEGPTPGVTSAIPVTVASASPAEGEAGESAGLAEGVAAPAPPQTSGQSAPVPAAEVGAGAPENVPVPEFPERATETAQAEDDQEDALSADRIPVPTRRPEPVMTASIAQPAAEVSQFAVAALSPAEIENLRRTAVPSSEAASASQLAMATPAAAPKKPSTPLPKVAATELAMLSEESPAAADAAARLIATGKAGTTKDSGPSRQTLELALAATNENSADALQAIRNLIDSGGQAEIETASAAQPAAPAKRATAAANHAAAKATWKDKVGRYALAAVRDIGLVRDLKAPGYTASATDASFVVAGFTKTPAPAAQNRFDTQPDAPALKVRTN
jgi:uncharacterized protein YcbK (DUF882 family)